MITAAATVAVYVSDTDEALHFWTEQVGFEIRADRSMGSERWLEVGPSGADTALVLYPKSMMDDWKTRRPGIVFDAADIEATCETLIERGVTISQPLAEMPWGMFAAFIDPEGNEFGLRSVPATA